MAVEDVGTGVGYVVCSSRASRVRLSGLGRAGEDESGSKAGRRAVAGRLEPDLGETAASASVVEGAMLLCWVVLSHAQRGSRSVGFKARLWSRKHQDPKVEAAHPLFRTQSQSACELGLAHTQQREDRGGHDTD